MKKFFWGLVTFLGLVFTVLTFYYQVIRKEVTSINVERVNAVLLTRPLNINGLKVTYTYNDTIDVKELWQTTFLIRNTGDKTILGEGFAGKNIRDTHIPIVIRNCNQLLSATVSDNSNGATLSKDRLYIKQWRPNEYVEITVISEGPNPPSLNISDREIMESEITYSVYSPKQDLSNKRLIDWLPNWLAFVLKWIITIIIVAGVISLIFQVPRELKKVPELWIRFFSLILFIGFMLFFASPLLWIF